jgi:hypothetical protein
MKILQKRSQALLLSVCSSNLFISHKGWISGQWPCTSEEVDLSLLLKTCASEVMTQGFELGTLLGELLGETALQLNGAGPSGLLVLRARAAPDRCLLVQTL